MDVLILLVYRWNEFDEPLDGVVYGVALALGFATVENVLCVVRDGLGIGVMRAMFAVPAHALFGAAMGFYFGRAKFDQGGKLWRDRAFLLAPTAFHGGYDYALRRGMGAHVWLVITLLSAGLWVFVLARPSRAEGVTFSLGRRRVNGYDSRMRGFVMALVVGLTSLGCTKTADTKAAAARRRSSTSSGRRWRTRSSRSSISRTIAAKG